MMSIDKQQSPQKEILQKVRNIFQTLPSCEEEMRWGLPTIAAGKFYLAVVKHRVRVGFAITGLNDDEIGKFEGSGKTMRHIKNPTVEEIDEPELIKLITLVDKEATCTPC